jgi:cysteine synthase
MKFVYVNPKTADETTRLLALQEGIFVGPSSGAIFHVAMEKAKCSKVALLFALHLTVARNT